MITEPEMSDEFGGAPATGDSAPLDGSTGTAASVGRPRPWLWAVGGVAVASAVWAAVLHADAGRTTDLHGYHLSGNPCRGDALAPLERAAGAPGFAASDAMVSTGPAVDELSCTLSAAAPVGRGWGMDYVVTVTVQLHKKTDPRAEFDNAGHVKVSSVPGDAPDESALIVTTDTRALSAADVHPVAGVGDEAYVLTPEASDQTLKVLHGGAVLTLRISGYNVWNGPGSSRVDSSAPEADLTHLRPAMTTSMRRLMASLSS